MPTRHAPEGDLPAGTGSSGHPLWTAMRGGIETFQLDRSCALLLLAAAAMAAFGVLAALAVGAVRGLDVTLVTGLLVGLAVVSALAGRWIWRRSRRLGVRPLGLRIVAVLQFLAVVPFCAEKLVRSWRGGGWGAFADLLVLLIWIGQSIWLWRAGRRPADQVPAV